MDSKKIIIFANKYPNELEPNVNVFTQQIAWSFADAGIDCIVVCPIAVNYNIKYMKFNEFREEITDSGRVIKIFQPKYLGLGQTGKFMLKLRVKLTQWLYTKAVDKILKNNLNENTAIFAEFLCPSGVAAAILGKKYGLRAYMQCGEATYQGDSKYGNSYLKKKLDSLTGVIALSGQNKEFLVNAGIVSPEKIIIMPSGYRKDRIYKRDKIESRKKFNLPIDKFIVGFCGSFDDRKGILRLEKAIDKIDDDDIVLAAVGKGKVAPSSIKCVFKGPINHSELGYFYSAIDVFAFPTYNEGCCTAIVEAIACGSPIISSNRSFNFEICKKENSILIDPDDINAITESIIYLKNNMKKRMEMSKASLNISRDLSLDSKARKIIEYIFNV